MKSESKICLSYTDMFMNSIKQQNYRFKNVKKNTSFVNHHSQPVSLFLAACGILTTAKVNES